VRHVVRPATPSATAASLFDEASAARRRGDYTAAFALHHDLESKFPGSREAQESRGAMARLLLDRGDDAAAMDMFESYLNAGGGGLREEAMAGRAEALDRLGRSVDARRAWQELLEAFPLTTYADHARARMSGPSDP
jgi:TolA-binding protein